MPENKEFSLLVKLLKMTTSSNDQEALAFIRKANEQLNKLGWTWEKLLTSRVTIVEDPFADAPVISTKQAQSYTQAEIGKVKAEAYEEGYAAAKRQFEHKNYSGVSVPPTPKASDYESILRSSSGFRAAGTQTRRFSGSKPAAPVQGPPRRSKAPKARSYPANNVKLEDIGL